MKTKLNIPGIALILATGFILFLYPPVLLRLHRRAVAQPRKPGYLICNSSASNPAYITLTKNGSTVSVFRGFIRQ